MPEVRTLLTGLTLGESPRWHDHRLWFSDWVAHEVVSAQPDGTTEVVLRTTSFPFAVDWLPEPDGRLLLISAGDRALLRREPNGSVTTHADLRGLSDRPWSEIVVDGRGNAYVNGIGFDMMSGEDVGPGLVALVTPDGSARKVADDVMFPNGMAVTGDNSTLIVAESYRQQLTAFDIDAGGDLSRRRAWAEVDGPPDGICLDAEGAIWYADVPNNRCTRVREGGEVLDRIELDRGCFACMLGGDDGKTLYMMAAEWGGPAAVAGGPPTGQVVTAAAPVAGAGWP